MGDEIIIPNNFKQNKQTQKFIYNLNTKLNSLNCENGNENNVLLDYRKNLINIPKEKYQKNLPTDLILAHYNRFTLLSYMHITLSTDSLYIEYIRILNNYKKKSKYNLLLSILLKLSRLINTKLNLIHINSINNRFNTYMCIFEFYAIPQVLYYKNNSVSTDIKDIKDDEKSFEFKTEAAEIKDKSIGEKYNYIDSIYTRFGNELILIIDINDSILSMINI